jgi:hypothetical protein
MVDTSQATHSYFTYARAGVAKGITDAFAETLPARADLTVDVQLKDGAGSASPKVFIHGPGSVKALDQGQIGRVEPKPGAHDWTPSWFPLIEFRRPDLPWLFSPFGPGADRLRPWIVLVVVELGDGVTYEESHPPTGYAALTVEGAASGNDPRTRPDIELPDLDDSWAWAHVHMSGDFDSSELDQENSDYPQLVVSRIVSPRRMHTGKSYRACLVPAFEAGRAAALGESQVASTLEPAWKSGQTSVTLPVFCSWAFDTGPAGDFASLARLLKPIASPAGVGAQAMEGTAPGGGLPSAGATLGGLQGALQAPGADLGDPPTSGFVTSLRALLNAGEPTAGAPARALELPPPIYGRWPAGVTAVPLPHGRIRPWIAELNLDPRHRAGAALGTLVVQRHQEQLMASAWAQVGPIDRANQALAHAQLARQTARATYVSRFQANGSGAALLLLAAPALARVPTGGAVPSTLFADAMRTRLAAALSPAFRRVCRGRGPLARGVGRSQWPASLVERLNSDSRVVVPRRTKPDGTQTAAVAGMSENAVLQGDPSNLHLDGPMQRQTFQQAAAAIQAGILGWTARADPTRPPPLKLPGVRVKLLAALDPDKTLPARVAQRVKVPLSRAWNPSDPLEGIMAAPEFPAPMANALLELSQDYLLPGLANLPQNSVTVVEANNRFINSFMIGLNHEMSRELLWREYPTDQRGTYFRQFWDPSTRVPPPGETTPPDLHDLSPLHTWSSRRRLDQGEGAAKFGKLVLVVRGQLLRRFPEASLLAIEATSGTPRGLGTAEKWPVFEGRLEPDLNYFGFDLSRTEAKTGGSQGAGWFFVLQQHPTRPHYGLEEEEAGTANVAGGHAASWAELSWAHLCSTEAELERLSYAPATPPASATPTDTSGPAWGTDSAQAAAVALRTPVRIAIHATDVIP